MFEEERVFLFEIRFCPFSPGFDGVQIHVNGFLFALEVKAQRGADLFHINADHLRQHAYINHVANQITKIRRNIRVFLDGLFDRHGIHSNISAGDGLLDIVSVEKGSARRDRCKVARERVGVDRDDDVLFLASPKISVFAGADRIPGGQTLNIGREEVFARDGDAHLEDRAQDGVVGG